MTRYPCSFRIAAAQAKSRSPVIRTMHVESTHLHRGGVTCPGFGTKYTRDFSGYPSSCVEAELQLGTSSSIPLHSDFLIGIKMSGSVASEVAIFWDYENCRPPSNLPGGKLVETIQNLDQIPDRVKVFKAYVDIALECVNPRSYTLHSELQSSGVTLVHCPHNGKKDVADKMMIVDMFAFALDNDTPTTIAIITGDRDFAYAVAVLRLRGYKVVIISPNAGHASLKMQADALYDWQKIMNDAISTEDIAENSVLSMNSPKTHVSNNATDVENWGHSKPSASQDLSKSILCSWSATPPLKSAKSSESIPTRIRAHDLSIPSAKSCSTPPILLNKPGCSYTTNCHDSASSPDSGDEVGQCDEEKRHSDKFFDGIPSLSDAWDVHSVKDDINDDHDSMSETSSSILSDSQSAGISVLFPTNSGMIELSSIRRFETLIEYFYDQWVVSDSTTFRSSIVASEMLKQDPAVYEKAGVCKMKQYIEEARQANVIVPPAMDSEGDWWIEINDALYSIFGAYRMDTLPSSDPEGSHHSAENAIVIVDPVYEPLIDRLRMEPSYQLLYSTLGVFFKREHPYLYEQAGVRTLSQYLGKAEEQGIVILLSDDWAGSQRVELVSALQEYDSITCAWY
ncbi:hypothetical protein ACEPAI_5207 [Sanghuangporus weigelae]